MTFRKLLHYDKFADSRSVSEKMRKHVTITFQEKDVNGHHSGDEDRTDFLHHL